jgi:hypothetical protein
VVLEWWKDGFSLGADPPTVPSNERLHRKHPQGSA